jgi:hypothetical protein
VRKNLRIDDDIRNEIGETYRVQTPNPKRKEEKIRGRINRLHFFDQFNKIK